MRRRNGWSNNGYLDNMSGGGSHNSGIRIASKERDPTVANDLRRSTLLPIAEALLADANKFVRHGMMQFLGPFLASFYPYVDSALHAILPGNSEARRFSASND